jgi:hypothetical protein
MTGFLGLPRLSWGNRVLATTMCKGRVELISRGNPRFAN